MSTADRGMAAAETGPDGTNAADASWRARHARPRGARCDECLRDALMKELNVAHGTNCHYGAFAFSGALIEELARTDVDEAEGRRSPSLAIAVQGALLLSGGARSTPRPLLARALPN